MNDASPYLRRLVAARTRASKAGMKFESIQPDILKADDKPGTDDVLHRVQELMKKMPQEEVADPGEFERALAVFLGHADRALRTMDRDPFAPLDRNASFAMEAVIRTDGTRPSLLVKGNTVDPDHPMAGTWHDTLVAVKDSMRERFAAIGRVEPANPGAGNFFGTAWLVDKAKGLVLTNLHVLEAMWSRLPNQMISNSTGGYRVLAGAAFVDFAAESGSLEKRRFQVIEGTPSGVDGAGFARLDAAVLRIEPLADSPALLTPIPVVADTDGPQGNLSSFCVVGFPGIPPYTSGMHEGVDWIWVNQTLFDGRFGVKRLAPGQAHKALGTLGGDAKSWVFGHDATTLGGSSGSPALAWLDTKRGGFGLHFAGASVDTNCAHAIAKIRDRLTALGVPVQNP